MHDVGFEVIVLITEAVGAIGTPDAVESGWFPKLQGKSNLDRRVAGPSAHLPEVLAVVEDPGEECV
jgi:hypothetical protein